MYCGYCVHEYYIYITFTDEALPQDTQNSSTRKVLEEQVALGLYYILFQN